MTPPVRGVCFSELLPLGLPCALLVLGAAIGYPISLNQAVATERLLGLLVASVLAVGATLALRRVTHPGPLLVIAAIAALIGGVWVMAASGPDVFRGTVGASLLVAFGPVVAQVHLTDPVAVSNTRFIVGYNGLADLCLVAIFCCGALLVERRSWLQTVLLAALLGIVLVVLVGTGARGALTGLAAGICAAGLYAWPRRYALGTIVAAPAALGLLAVGILDKGLEFSSTAGRMTYWSDLMRLLVEFPITGVGLGVDTADTVALQYEVNPDPERVFYAHNTFVQTYLEQGPLGFVGALLVPAVAVGAALIARRAGVVNRRRALVLAGLGVVGGLEAHGLTDQVVTTNVGTGLVLLGIAAILAGLTPSSLAELGWWTRRAAALVAVISAVAIVGLLVTPGGRAQLLLDFGGTQMTRALELPPESYARAAVLQDAESVLLAAGSQDEGHPAVLRDLARVRAARFDDSGALDVLNRAASSPRIDAFDMLQIALVYRELGFVHEAYAWASRAYTMWGRSPDDAVMQRYAQSTLIDSRARTVAEQAEAAMVARHFSQAYSLFEQALTFEPSSAYLQDRIGAAQRAVDKYGG